MTVQRFVSAFEEIDADTSGGIICSEGEKRDGLNWIISGITYGDELPLNVEHAPPPVGVFIRIGQTTVNGVPALAGVFKWGPESVPRVAETRALVKAGIYNTLSASINPLKEEYRDGVLTVTKSELLEASVVSVPADPLARITMRSFDPGTATRILRTLPRVPEGAIERMMARVVRANAPSKPIGLMEPWERAAHIAAEQRSRTMAAWGHSQATQLDDREQRRAEADRLGAIGESYGVNKH